MKPKRNQIKRAGSITYIIIAIVVFFVLSIPFGYHAYQSADNAVIGVLLALGRLWWAKIIIAALLSFLLYIFSRPSLDIVDRQAGHGQHGDAKLMSNDEVKETYNIVDIGKEKISGLLVGQQGNQWTVDTTDQNLMLLAPPSAGKTTSVFIPTVKYNAQVNKNTAGKGASMLLMDIKGTLYATTAAELQACGYETPVINLREVFNSYHYNIMYQVNREIDAFKTASDGKSQAIHYGAAERYAKITAAAVMNSADVSIKSDGSEYFNETAKGLITGLILLVSEYAEPKARHIMSVYDLIIQLNEQDSGGMLGCIQVTKLASMMQNITNKRVQSYVGAATGADIRTTLNIFSSALAKLVRFVDAELEQLVCEHSPQLTADSFISKPTALFVICPDENPTRHFLASLFVRALTDELIELAETKYEGVLPRNFIYLIDEFGNFPAISHVDTIFSAIRSRGGRVMIALQSYAQLLKSYSRETADIIRDTCQILMFSFVAPSAEGTATTLSKMLGNETIVSGSTSVTRGVHTTSTQLIGRQLFSPDQLVRLEKNDFIVMKGTENPMLSHMRGYWEYIELEDTLLVPPPEVDYSPVVTASAEYIAVAASGKLQPLTRGMFD